ncbi:bifunctional folylpolyglutamate synthase/dihydrofolate synthase [Propionispira arboris]|nr:folylpolyglutamate synthase/dihydrofolate synthase family protein [Propionispira arboris]
MNYQETLLYLDSLNTFGIKLGLERITSLLKRMDQPQNRYKTIHVTGTNGKGSTTNMLAGILTQAKIKTGMYTSPHLVSYTERMQIDGHQIREADFANCISQVKLCADQMVADGNESPTQFEVLTAGAFLYFATMKVEYAVIEVGLGGLLDSTNVIVPEVSVITNVTFEHADRCGGTLAGIAAHKAGIIKEGVPVVTAADGETLQIIRETAHAKNSDIFVAGEDFSAAFIAFDGHKQKLAFSSRLLGASEEYFLRVLGKHQIENSSLAIMTALLIHNQDSRVTMEGIGHALDLATWAGRFEIMNQNNQKILVDGAHNLAGMKVLRSNLDSYFPAQERVILLGILKDKDVDGMIETLIRPIDTVVVTEPSSDRAAMPDYIAKKIKSQHVEAYIDIPEALARAQELAGSNRLLCIAGSLYLIGEARQLLLTEQ